MIPTKRELVIAEARTWLGTAWRHEGRVKGAGVDCAQFLIAVYAACGLIEEFKTEHYPSDWMLHSDQPRFMAQIKHHCVEVIAPRMGDVLMFRVGRQPAHAAIAMDDGANVIIHAYREERCVTLTDLPGSPLAERLCGFYSLAGLT